LSPSSSNRPIALVAAFCCLVIACSALAGWWFNLPELTRFATGGPRMFPLTAAGIIAVSSILILHSLRLGDFDRIACLLSSVVSAFGGISAFMRMADWGPAPLSLATGASASFLSLPAFVTSCLFIATGASLGMMSSRRTIGFAQATSVGILLFCLLTLLGFLSSDTFLYQALPGKGTSLPTTIAFLLAACGVLSLRPSEGVVAALYSSSATGPLRQLMLPALLSPILLGTVATATIQAVETETSHDVVTIVWLFAWSLLIVLTLVIWRFAGRLHQAEISRTAAENERTNALEALRLANERKNEFLAMLAHELRNPLAPISTAAELLRTVYTADAGQVRCASEVISRQVNHMVHLVNDLLDVSRVTQGLIEIKHEKLDLCQVAADALEQIQPLLEMKRHRLVIDMPGKKVNVLGDHKRLVQVLVNLLNNAAKYTSDGGSLAFQVVTAGQKAIIKIQDNGIGIAPELLPDIFGLFTQAKRTPDRSQGGLGLGLALVKNLTELHGGQVSGHSDGLGKGSIFTVELPWAVDVGPQETETPKISSQSPVGGELSIMVVDDNVDAAETLSALLRADGHKVFVEHTSMSAIDRARRYDFDVCITDIGLPDLDGYELARRLRELTRMTGLVLIALTGYNSEEGRAAAAKAGFAHYLVKPVSVHSLAEVLKTIATRSRGKTLSAID
jgi:signal transduction histidine kinase/CheY-like chemotaxis protein